MRDAPSSLITSKPRALDISPSTSRHVGFVALGPTLIDAAPSGNLFVGLPVERVPVANDDLALPQPVERVRRHDSERLVVVLRAGRLQDREAAPDRKAGRDHEHVLREARVLAIGDLVENLPGYEHGHHHRLARAGGHLGAHSPERAAVGRHFDTHPVRGGSFREPDERLRCLQLAEEKASRLELLGVRPVFEQPLGNAGDTGVSGLAPSLDTLPYLVDQRDLHEHARIVEHPRPLRRHQVPRRPPTPDTVEPPSLPLILPVRARLLVRRVYDETVYGRLGHLEPKSCYALPGKSLYRLRWSAAFLYRVAVCRVAASARFP